MIRLRARRTLAMGTGLLLGALAWAAIPTSSAGAPGAADSAGKPPSAALIATTAPQTATETISGGFTSFRYDKARITLAKGGTLKVTNNSASPHTLTSNATAGGNPLFNVSVQPHRTVVVPGVSRLAPGTYKFHCTIHPYMTATLVIVGTGGGTHPTPQRFVQPLRTPPVLTGSNISLHITRAQVQILPAPAPKTTMWTYNGTYPGPTIERTVGQGFHVTVTDDLPLSAGSFTLHFHGDHHPSDSDGRPAADLISRGHPFTYDFPLTDGGKAEPAAFDFYHDHRMMLTSRNNWMGLQGMVITHDPAQAKALGLPSGTYDLPVMVSDRSFTKTGQLTNPFPGGVGTPPGDAVTGTRYLVDGQVAPFLNVATHRYRLRLLNASNFTSYDFKLSDGRSFVQVGTGDALLPHPVTRKDILLGPAQRADVVVDFSGEFGKNVTLDSVPRTARPAGGVDSPSVQLMQFRVKRQTANSGPVPQNLAAAPRIAVPSNISETWTLGFNKATKRWTLNGQAFVNPNTVLYKVHLGDTEKWRIVNATSMTHYVHLHEEQWHTILRDGKTPPPWERGLEDTWRLDPGESVVVAAHFTDWLGPFMIHCHMLDHEDDGLMAQFEVVPRGASTAVAVPPTAPARPAARSTAHDVVSMPRMAPMRGMAPMAAAKPAAARIRAEQRPPAHVNVAGFWPRLGVAGAVEAAALAMVVLAVAGWRRYVRWIDRMA